MQILKTEELRLTPQIKLTIIIYLFFSSFLFSQKLSNYYLTNNTVTFKNPVIIVPNYDRIGVFIAEYDDYEKEKNINILYGQKKAFLFDTSPFRTESIFERENLKYNMTQYQYLYRKVNGKTIVRKLNQDIKSFYVGFIKLDYHNHIHASAEIRKPFLKNSNNYEVILIPTFTD